MNEAAIQKLHQIFDAQDVRGHIQPFPFTQETRPSVSMDFGFTNVFLDRKTETVIAFYKTGVNNFEFPGYFQGEEYPPDKNWYTHEHVAIELDDIQFVEYIMADEDGCPNVRIYMKNGDQYCVYLLSKCGME